MQLPFFHSLLLWITGGPWHFHMESSLTTCQVILLFEEGTRSPRLQWETKTQASMSGCCEFHSCKHVRSGHPLQWLREKWTDALWTSSLGWRTGGFCCLNPETKQSGSKQRVTLGLSVLCRCQFWSQLVLWVHTRSCCNSLIQGAFHLVFKLWSNRQ